MSAYAASIVKVPILLATAAHDQALGHDLTASERAAATSMIEASNNDSATTLWRDAGRAPALFTMYQALGMTHTAAAPVLIEPWDGLRTTPDDQIRLLRALVTAVPGVSKVDRNYLLSLMENVESDQQWGVPTGARQGSTVAVKNGWVPVGSEGWTVNSIGIVQNRHAGEYALAIMSTGSSTEAAGITTVDLVARATAKALGGR